MMMEPSFNMKVLPFQMEAMFAEERWVGVAAGLGAGKSLGCGLFAYQNEYINQGYPTMLISRSGSQLENLQVEVNKVYDFMGFQQMDILEWRKAVDQPRTYCLFNGRKYFIRRTPGVVSEIFCHTAENRAYTRWAGGNRAAATVDEFDTMADAEEVFRFVNDRVRIGNFNRIGFFSTPEGVGKYMHKRFVLLPQQDPTLLKTHRLIQASSFDNPWVNLEWLESQIDTRDPAALRAYLYGEFVNLAGTVVYFRFDKTKNWTDKTLAHFKEYRPHVGVDFNKGINATSISFMKEGKLFTVAQIKGALNVDELIFKLKKMLEGYYMPFIYPDASGFEGIQQLEREFGKNNIIYPNKNPDVDKRVALVNTTLCDHNGVPGWFINPVTAPDVWNDIQHQVKDKNGDPDKKSGLDHFPDQSGYKIWNLFKPKDAGTARVISGY